MSIGFDFWGISDVSAAFDIAQNLLDLRREKFHASEANQVIGPAEDSDYTEKGPAK